MTEWGDDNLSKFLNAVHSNQKANYANFQQPYLILQRINDCLFKAGKHLTNPNPVMAGILFLRSQYAYKTAAGMALSGQVVETFVMMRSCLEYAGYALIIFETPTLEPVFMNRHQGDAEMIIHKKKFNASEVRATITRFDSKLAEIFNLFYQRTIDFGGHPNPNATFSALKMDDAVDGKSTSFTAIALSSDTDAVLHAMKSVAQVGLTVLYIFQHIFKAKFELLGIRAEIDALKQRAGL
jgi:hypothetical protein